MRKAIFISYLAALSILSACTTRKSTEDKSISTDPERISAGNVKFNANCLSCHNFKEDGIGPHLGGLTQRMPGDWIKRFIKDPKTMIDSDDTRAQELFGKFKTIMPSFAALSDTELDNILAYINTKPAPDPRKVKLDPNAIKNPIPEPIPMSDLVVDLELYAQFPNTAEDKPITRITKLDWQPNTKELYVVDLRGKLYHLNNNKPEVYLDMGQLMPKFIHKPGLATGFGSFAFHPEFAKNGLLYTTHTESPVSGKADYDYNDSIKVTLQWVLSEWKTKQPGAFPFSGESRELLRVNMVSPIHGVQEITFNPLAKPSDADYGLLYIGIGDGGSSEYGYPFLCGSTKKIWGSVIRIDPRGNNGPNGQYGIPGSNPFAKSEDPSVVKEIFAYGFRNPHRITWSRAGQILISNVGHHNAESLYIIVPGSNCGWPTREGTFVIDPSQNMHNIYPLPADDSKNNFTYPVAEYDHDEGNAISGGLEYWGSKLPQLKGKFVFGDIVQGRLFYVEMKDLKAGSLAPIREWRVSIGRVIKSMKELTGADKVDERFGRDIDGEMYITTKPDGKMYKLVGSRIVQSTR